MGDLLVFLKDIESMLGDRIRMLRTSRHITQLELASSIGV